MTTDDDLDDLLGSEDDTPLIISEDGLDDLVERAPPPVAIDDVSLQDLEQGHEHVSLITDFSSSLFAGEASRLRFRQLATKDLRDRPSSVAKRLWAQADAAEPGANPLDHSLSTGRMMELISALQQAEAQVLEGSQVALIVTGPESKPLSLGQNLALHLNATPVDGIVFMDLTASDVDVRRELLSRGMMEGQDYEMVDALALLAYERKVLTNLLSSRRKPKLRILRRLSKKPART